MRLTDLPPHIVSRLVGQPYYLVQQHQQERTEPLGPGGLFSNQSWNNIKLLKYSLSGSSLPTVLATPPPPLLQGVATCEYYRNLQRNISLHISKFALIPQTNTSDSPEISTSTSDESHYLDLGRSRPGWSSPLKTLGKSVGDGVVVVITAVVNEGPELVVQLNQKHLGTVTAIPWT